MSEDKKAVADEKKQPATLKLASNIQATAVKVKLCEIVLLTDRYFHRDPAALLPQSLRSLMDSLILEKMQAPIEGFFDASSNFTLVQGYRRVTALRLLVDKNTPGFTADMEVEALLLENGTLQDHLVRSVSGNGVRENLTRPERIRAAKRMYDGGVEEARAAAALAVSAKTYQRDLLIAKHNWMFEHVIDSNIEATAATELLEAGEKHKCLALVKDDFAAWVAQQKQLIREREKVRKINGSKDLSPAEKQVKRKLLRHLLDHWLELIQQGKRFDDDAEWDFIAGIDPETRQLHIGAVTLDLGKDPPEKIAKVLSKCSLLSKQAAPHLKRRLLPEEGNPVAEEQVYDEDYLKEVGAVNILKRMKARSEHSKAQSGTAAAMNMDDLMEEAEIQAEEPAAEVPAEDMDQEELGQQSVVESAGLEQSTAVS